MPMRLSAFAEIREEQSVLICVVTCAIRRLVVLEPRRVFMLLEISSTKTTSMGMLTFSSSVS